MAGKSMADIMKELRKQHGEEGLFAGDEDTSTNCKPVCSTGSHAFDAAIGIWGLPRGRIVQYAGAESSGKTLMSLVAIANYQKMHPENWAVFVDAEYTWDPQWAKSLGVDLSRVLLFKENSGSKIFELLTGRPKRNKNTGAITKSKPGILDLEEQNPSRLGIIVLDSIAAIQPPAEESSEAGKQNMSLLARFMPPELRKLTPALSKTGVCFIAINQVRTDPGKMFGDPTTTPGGAAWKHMCSIMAMFGPKMTKDFMFFDEDGDESGHHIKIKITKNKLYPRKSATVAIKYLEGVVNKGSEIRDLAHKYGIVNKINNTTWEFDGEKYKGKDSIAEKFEDESLQSDLLSKIKEVRESYVPGSNSREKENEEQFEDEGDE